MLPRIRKFFGNFTVWVLLCCLFVAGLSAALAGLARSPAARDLVKQELSAVILRELGVRATFSDVDLAPQSFAVVARGISLDHPSGGRLLDAAELSIRPSWWALIRGQLDLNVVRVDRATLWLKIRDGQLVNAPELPQTEDTQDESLSLPLNHLTLQHARVLVDAGEVAAEISSIDVWLDATRDGRIGVRADVGTGSLRHSRGMERLQQAQLALTVFPKRIEVERVALRTPDLDVQVQDGQLGLPPLEAPYEGHVDVGVDLAALARLTDQVALPDLRGRVRVRGEVAGPAKIPVRSADLLLEQVHVEKFGLGERVAVAVVRSPGQREHLTWSAVLEAVDDGGELHLNGELDLAREDLPLRVDGHAQDVQFAKLIKQLGVTPNAIVSWLISGRFQLAGSLNPLNLRGDLMFNTRDFLISKGPYHRQPQESILRFSWADLVGSVRISEAGIQFVNVDAQLERSRVEIQEVLLGFDNALRVSGQGASVDLRDVSPLLDFSLDGQGGFDVQVRGTFSKPEVTGSANFKRFAFGGFGFGDIATDFHLEHGGQAVRFTDVHFRKNSSRYRSDDLFMDFRDGKLLIDTELDFRPITMVDFYRIFHYEEDERFMSYQGRIVGRADVRYTLGYPEDSEAGTLRVGMDFELPELDLNGYQFAGGLLEGSWSWFDHRAGYEGGELVVERLSMHKGRGTVNLSGRMSLGGKLDLVVVADSLGIPETEGLGDRVPGLTGRYGVTGTVRGLLSEPDVRLDLVGAGLRYQGAPLGESRAYVRMTDKDDPWIAEALQWPATGPLPAELPCAYGRRGLARGVWEPDPPIRVAGGTYEPALDHPMAWVMCGSALGGQLQVDLAVGRTKVMPLRGRLGFRELAYGKFLPALDSQYAFRGHASGHLDLTDGAMLQPDRLGGALHLDDLRMGQFSVSLRNDGPIDLSFGEGVLRVRQALLRGPSSHLQVQGRASVHNGLSLTVGSSMDLSLLSQVTPAVRDVAGRLQLEFNLAGPLEAPKVYGQAQVSDVSFRSEGLPTPVVGVQGQLVFSEHRVLIEKFRGQLASGEFTVSGSASLAGRGLGRYRLNIEASGMRLRPQEGIDLGFGARTELSWREGDRLPSLRGVVRLDHMRYARDVQMASSLQDMYRTERREVTTYSPDADHLALDLRLVESRPLRIENNLIDAELALDTSKQPFRIVGTDQRFGVLGNMSVRHGTLRFRDTTFDIRDGEFRFRDPLRISPSFDLRAVTDVRRTGQLGQDHWHISLHAWGSQDEFRWELSSDPHLSEDDIALMLTVGMTHAELAQLETGELTSTAALEALATVTGVEREVKRVLPTIDEFRVQSAYSQSSNRTEPQLYIGKRIADRIRLSAATGVGESRDFRTGVELQVSDQTSVQGVYNNQNATSASQLGDVGVDLKWRLEFD